MELYCVNRQVQSNGDHEVHRAGCIYWPSSDNAILLGYHTSCASAVASARRYYSQTNGCFTCSRACHTS